MAKKTIKKDLPFDIPEGANITPYGVDKPVKSTELKPHQFQHNNEMWKLVTDPGRKKSLDSPEHLFKLFLEYCQEIDDNPWSKIDYKGKDATKVDMRLAKPYTWKGFGNFLFLRGIISDLDDYKANKKKRYDAFSEIITRIDDIIFDRKYTGATVGAFNASIIARDLKLVDASDITTGGKKLGSSPSKIEIEIVRSKDEDE